MARQVQLRRGTTAENNNFTGAAGELTFDTSTKAVRAHDGSKKGGYLLDSVVAYQTPNSGNGYTWYRKYASGWVEQGGFCNATQYNNTGVNVTFPIAMADTNYIAITSPNTPNHQETWAVSARCAVKTTTNMCVHGSNNANSAYTGVCAWQVSGMAA